LFSELYLFGLTTSGQDHQADYRKTKSKHEATRGICPAIGGSPAGMAQATSALQGLAIWEASHRCRQMADSASSGTCPMEDG
jgi:hypothetical protein